MSIVDFIDWLESVWGREYFFVFCSFFGAFLLLLYTSCVLWFALFDVFNINLIYWLKKKKSIIGGKYREEASDVLDKWDEYGVGLWKAFWKDWDIFNCRVSFYVSNGERIEL